jgi:hypothetical protein
LLINDNGSVIDTGDSDRINDLSVLPSPYTNGFFDQIIADNPDVEWMSTLETNRGCPYQCTFCDWGSLTLSKIKQFPLEKVFAELEWISKNKCGTLYVADANFGIFPERDNLIVDRFIELRNKYGLPYYWATTWAKNQKKEVINIIKKLSGDSEFYSLGLNISLQTLNEQVLLNIKRKNMHDMSVTEMFNLAEEMQQPSFTELILGLPGETLSSWKENFYKLFRMDIQCFADVSVAQVLENAEMNLVQREVYDIKTKEVSDYLSGTYNNDQWLETIPVVVSTRDLPSTDMISAAVFTWFITTFHMHYFSSFASRFLFKHCDIDYKIFYDKLFDLLSTDPWFAEEINLVETGLKTWQDQGLMEYPPLSNGIKIHSWNLFNSTAIKIHSENQYQRVFFLIEQLLNSFDLEKELIDDVMQFQRMEIIDLHRLDSYPQIKKFKYNVYECVVKNQELLKLENNITFDFRYEKKPINQEYIERVFYSRKNFFTKSIIIN